MTPKRIAMIYGAAGFAWWLYLQFAYVAKGLPYWQGFGSIADPTQTLGGVVLSAETIALWPVSAVQTLALNKKAGY